MIRIDICYATWSLEIQNVAPTLPGFQSIKHCVQYLASHPYKPTFYPSTYYDVLNVIRLTRSGNKVEYYTTQNCLECHQDAYHDIVLNRRRSVSDIFHTIIGVAFWRKLQIQPAIASDSTDEEIRCMYKDVKKTKVIWRYMDALSLHSASPTVHWEGNTIWISFVEAKIVTPRVKHVDVPVWFLQEQFDNGIFIPNYEKSSIMPAYMCTKTCSVTIISRSTKLMNGFRFYPTSDTEHYQLIILHEFSVN